ncbi:MAG: hypothetical protein AAF529_24240 [Pseudomonadota bacterium]
MSILAFIGIVYLLPEEPATASLHPASAQPAHHQSVGEGSSVTERAGP